MALIYIENQPYKEYVEERKLLGDTSLKLYSLTQKLEYEVFKLEGGAYLDDLQHRAIELAKQTCALRLDTYQANLPQKTLFILDKPIFSF